MASGGLYSIDLRSDETFVQYILFLGIPRCWIVTVLPKWLDKKMYMFVWFGKIFCIPNATETHNKKETQLYFGFSTFSFVFAILQGEKLLGKKK